MKKTIKQLEERLEQMEKDKDYWYSECQKLRKEKDDKQFRDFDIVKRERDELSNQVKNLLEIIRWKINPETAKYPFHPERSQREEPRRNY